MNVPLVPIPVTSIPYARVPWVHTHARVMLGTQEMENLAMVFYRQSNLQVTLPLSRPISGDGVTNIITLKFRTISYKKKIENFGI